MVTQRHQRRHTYQDQPINFKQGWRPPPTITYLGQFVESKNCEKQHLFLTSISKSLACDQGCGKQLKAQGEQIYMSESGLKFIWIITTDIDEHT